MIMDGSLPLARDHSVGPSRSGSTDKTVGRRNLNGGLRDVVPHAVPLRHHQRIQRSRRENSEAVTRVWVKGTALAIRDALARIGVAVRSGLHTGEVEIRGDDVAGMAVHIGARVAAMSRAGEVFVSSTMKDLVAGSGIEFEDRGEHELRGVPGTWKVFAVCD